MKTTVNRNKRTIYKILYRFGDNVIWDIKNNKEAQLPEVECYSLDMAIYFNNDTDREDGLFEFQFNTCSETTLSELKEALDAIESHPEKDKYTNITFDTIMSESDGYIVCKIIYGERLETDEELQKRIEKEQALIDKIVELKKQRKINIENAKIEKAKALLAKANIQL